MNKVAQASKTRGQHYAPRFLLNSFASRRSGREYYVWQFKQNDIVESNTRGVGKERDFHGHPDVSTLESEIAVRETRFANLVRKVHDLGLVEEDIPEVRELIVHLVVRTKNMREGFAELADDFWAVTEEKLSAPDKKLRRQQRHIAVKTIHQELRKSPLKDLLAKLPSWRRKIIINSLQDSAAKLDFGLAAKNAFSEFRHLLNEKSTEAATRAQLGALQRELVPVKRVEQLLSFSWRLLYPRDADLVLGDVVVIGSADGNFVHPITGDEDTPLQGIVLPIAPDCAIIGGIDAATLTAMSINVASVELSREWFVARRVTEAERELVSALGRRVKLFEPTRLRQMLE